MRISDWSSDVCSSDLADDIAALGLRAGDRVDLESLCDDGVRRQARRFLLVEYDIPRGCLAAYYPETNALVPPSSFADPPRPPPSKSIPVVVTAPDPSGHGSREARSDGPRVGGGGVSTWWSRWSADH